MVLYLTLTNKNVCESVISKPSWYDERFIGVLEKEQVKNSMFSSRKKIALCFSLVILHIVRLSTLQAFFSSNSETMQVRFDSLLTMQRWMK